MARERAGYEELRLGKLSFIGECPSAHKADFRLDLFAITPYTTARKFGMLICTSA